MAIMFCMVKYHSHVFQKLFLGFRLVLHNLHISASSVKVWMCPWLWLHLFSFSRRWRVRCSSSLSWQSRWASRWPWGESCSRAGLEWRRRYWSSSLSPPTQEIVHTEHISGATQQQTNTHTAPGEHTKQQVHKPNAHNAAVAYQHRTHASIFCINCGWCV